jgi:hypothetical protein
MPFFTVAEASHRLCLGLCRSAFSVPSCLGGTATNPRSHLHLAQPSERASTGGDACNPIASSDFRGALARTNEPYMR